MMSDIHICTTDSLMAGAIECPPSECPICLQITIQDLGYIGSRCRNCGRIWCSEMSRGSLTEKRREYLGLTRREVAARLGLKTATIRTYETSRCSESYMNAVKRMVEA